MVSSGVAYAITFFAVILVNPAFIGIVGGLLARGIGLLGGIFIAGLIWWNIISKTWEKFEGGVTPIAALVGALFFLFIHAAISNKELTSLSKWNMAGEAWAIIVFGGYLMFSSSSIRWF